MIREHKTEGDDGFRTTSQQCQDNVKEADEDLSDAAQALSELSKSNQFAAVKFNAIWQEKGIHEMFEDSKAAMDFWRESLRAEKTKSIITKTNDPAHGIVLAVKLEFVFCRGDDTPFARFVVWFDHDGWFYRTEVVSGRT
ncbi:MAG: hypothetical protein QOG91_561 [Candidatus Parcubacteria bacterium]|jgi:hypothetical protein|nr:hypothetical protein [Candidatus Parcubacteria bacterium]